MTVNTDQFALFLIENAALQKIEVARSTGEYVTFELAEVCSPEIPRETSHIDPTVGVCFIRSGDPIPEIARKKIKKSKNYRTGYPIDLVFYTDGRVVQTPEMSIYSI